VSPALTDEPIEMKYEVLIRGAQGTLYYSGTSIPAFASHSWRWFRSGFNIVGSYEACWRQKCLAIGCLQLGQLACGDFVVIGRALIDGRIPARKGALFVGHACGRYTQCYSQAAAAMRLLATSTEATCLHWYRSILLCTEKQDVKMLAEIATNKHYQARCLAPRYQPRNSTPTVFQNKAIDCLLLKYSWSTISWLVAWRETSGLVVLLRSNLRQHFHILFLRTQQYRSVPV